MLHRQEKHLGGSCALKQLGAIRIFLPAHVAQQRTIGTTECDEITPAAMIGTEHELFRLQFDECPLDVESAQRRTIAPDRDDFVIAQPRHRFNRALEAGRKGWADLAMDEWRRHAFSAGGGEQMDIDRGRKFGIKRRKTQERPGGHRERTSRLVYTCLLGEDEDSASEHALGYESAGDATRLFGFPAATARRAVPAAKREVRRARLFDDMPEQEYRFAMKLSDLRAVLEEYPDTLPRFVLPDGDYIPAHAHVTEVGHVSKSFIDCDGVTGKSETVLLQTHVGQDTDHRLQSDRFAKILQLGERVLPHDRLEVEVEYDCCVVAQYPVAGVKPAGKYLDVILEKRHTQCLARERQKAATATACCAAAATCC